jgi:hypothetical protein
MFRLIAVHGMVALLIVGCGGGAGTDSTTNPAQAISAVANKLGGPLKVADTYARSRAHGQPTDCKPGADCVYSAAFDGCITALRKTHRDHSYFLIYTRVKLSPGEAAIHRQAVQDCSHL